MRQGYLVAWLVLTLAAAAGSAGAVSAGLGPRALGLSQAYTAQARGPESVFWNPANLGLSGNSRYSWQLLGFGLSLATENNAWSVDTYNGNFTGANRRVSPTGGKCYLSQRSKEALLADVPGSGLKVDIEVEPMVAIGVPVNGGVSFPLPWELQSALAVGLTSGLEGQVPKDVVELALLGSEFAQERVAAGKREGYDVAQWDGSGWVVGSLNWALARAWMPRCLAPHLGEFAVGATAKLTGGYYAEVLDSGGAGMVVRDDGAEVDAYLLTQRAYGMGAGLDFGVAGSTRDGRTTLSLGLLNALDFLSWAIAPRQDSVSVVADDLLLARVLDPDALSIRDITDNEDVDGDGDTDFHVRLSERSFSRSMPAMLRAGVARRWSPRLTLVGAYDQAFSAGFGLTTRPRLAGGAEYRLVPWLPARFGLSLGGRWRRGSSFGFSIGPLAAGRVDLTLVDVALTMRGGVLPGVSKGTAVSVRLLEACLH